MKYTHSESVRDSDTLRNSFNSLTRRTFGFDFTAWHAAGHWGDQYTPHVLLDGSTVISNVSVSRMQFDMGGVRRQYLQLGTVMTAPEYRGQGCGRSIMESVLKKYAGKTDGIYLFANDDILDYYPKFGFRPSKEYEYFIPFPERTDGYTLEKADLRQPARLRHFEAAIKETDDAMRLCENPGLIHFHLAAGYREHLWYLPENDTYVIAEQKDQVLRIYQIFGKQYTDPVRLASSFGETVREVVAGYTPVRRETFCVREHREEDCTLFILGDDLARIENDRMMFPVLSHT